METHVGVFLSQRSVFLCVCVEIVEDDVKLVVREGGYDTVHEAEKFNAAGRFECDAMIFPVVTSSAANKVVVPCRL
jgi:bacterioferritin-associated ferredoxin